ncbi:MAG: AraC family transcriptional regulator [Pseudomonadota bacterium]
MAMMEQSEALTMNWRSVAIALMVACALIPQLYLWSKSIERHATVWLALFVLAVGINATPMIIGFAGAYDIWPGLTFLPVNLMLFFGPLLYLHARQLMMGVTPVVYYALLIPGLLNWVYELWAFTTLGDYRAKWAYNDAFHEPFIVPLVQAAALALGAWAFWSIWRMRRMYTSWLDANRSDADDFEPRWINHILVIGTIAALLWAVDLIVSYIFGLSYLEQFWWDLAVLFLVMLLSLEALARLEQPFPKMLAPDAVSVEELMEQVAAERDWVAEGERLRDEVIANGWHLESSLSLQTLSRRFGMNQAYVSRALNQGLDLSFSNFINGLRVEHAKGMIGRKDVNLLDVALSSGFGSKASFNRAFKLHAGVSPSEHRRLNS